MKCRTVIDESREEVVIYTPKITPFIQQIQLFVQQEESEILGVQDGEIFKLSLPDVCCFAVKEGKVYAMTEDGEYKIKQRLCEIENLVGDAFVKINQSCIANVYKMVKFDASFAGELRLTLKNGYSDYVSRRQLQNVKRRLNLKK